MQQKVLIRVIGHVLDEFPVGKMDDVDGSNTEYSEPGVKKLGLMKDADCYKKQSSSKSSRCIFMEREISR